ncbi:hypothetical protein Nepgr_012037 [Nepenthes gracilis]|uniref:Uncharacterized protein n=1 Tax=Nepenthes gracilis TaxID=150966 RepID=A0AAD3SGT4_NEPGR|nr:hypothetical protein Nepgr_012037 [Nepenthes gracilis]
MITSTKGLVGELAKNHQRSHRKYAGESLENCYESHWKSVDSQCRQWWTAAAVVDRLPGRLISSLVQQEWASRNDLAGVCGLDVIKTIWASPNRHRPDFENGSKMQRFAWSSSNKKACGRSDCSENRMHRGGDDSGKRMHSGGDDFGKGMHNGGDGSRKH